MRDAEPEARSTPATVAAGAVARAGSVREAEALQRAIHERSDADYLLLQEHPHVYTLGSSADPAHVLRDPGVGRRRAGDRPTAAAT